MVRQRTRHLLLELIWKDRRRELSQKEFTSLLLKWINRLYGPSGTASILPNLAVRFFDGRSSLCILRCSRNQQQQVSCFLHVKVWIAPIFKSLLEGKGVCIHKLLWERERQIQYTSGKFIDQRCLWSWEILLIIIRKTSHLIQTGPARCKVGSIEQRNARRSAITEALIFRISGSGRNLADHRSQSCKAISAAGEGVKHITKDSRDCHQIQQQSVQWAGQKREGYQTDEGSIAQSPQALKICESTTHQTCKGFIA